MPLTLKNGLYYTFKLVQHKHSAKCFVFWFFLLMVIRTDPFPVLAQIFFQRWKQDESYDLKIFNLLGFSKAFASWKPAQWCTQLFTALTTHLHRFILALADTEG